MLFFINFIILTVAEIMSKVVKNDHSGTKIDVIQDRFQNASFKKFLKIKSNTNNADEVSDNISNENSTASSYYKKFDKSDLSTSDFSNDNEMKIDFNEPKQNIQKNPAIITVNCESIHEKCHSESVDLVKHLNHNIQLSEFIVPKIFFETYWKVGAKQFSKGWTIQMNKYFESYNKKCVLIFKGHSLKYEQQGKKKITPFIATGYCKFKSCFKFKFYINEPLSYEDHKVILKTTGIYNHRPKEAHRRPIAGKLRESYAQDLKKEHVSVLVGEYLDKVEDEILDAGNFNDAPSDQIMYKILSEEKKKYDLDNEFYLFILKLQKLYEQVLPGIKIKGFIQGYTVLKSFTLTLFMEEQIEEMIKAKNFNGFLTLYFDATGKIFAQPPFDNKRVFYYCLVLSKLENKPPIAVSEFITTGHSVRNISSSLDIFVEAIRKYTTIWPLVDLIEVDFSKAMIQSSCKSFNNFDLPIYLDKCHSLITKPEVENEDFTNIHVCSSHLIKSAVKRIKTFTNDEKLQQLMRSAVGLLIHSTNYSHAQELFQILVIVFDLKEKNVEEYDIYLKALANIEHLDKNMKNIILNIKDDTEDSEKMDGEFVFKNTQREKSKFYQDFFKVRQQIHQSNDRKVKNDFYNPKFINYLLDELLPYYPLWSGIIICKFNIRRNSNASVESWNKYIKRYLFDGQMRQLIPRALMTLKKNVVNLLKRRKYDLRTTRQLNNALKKRNETDESKLDLKEPELTEKDESVDPDLKDVLENIEKSLDDGANIDEIITTVSKLNFSKKKKCNKRKVDQTDIRNDTKELLNEIKKFKESKKIDECSNPEEDLFKNVKRKESIIASKKIKLTAEQQSEDENSSNEMENSKIEIPYDMYTENWCRKNESRCIKVGFEKLPKNVDDWHAGCQKFESQSSSNESLIEISEKIPEKPVESNKRVITDDHSKPWRNVINNFDDIQWKNETFDIDGLQIDKKSLQTLLQNRPLNDNIINAFLCILKNEHEDSEPLIFDLHFFSSLVGGTVRTGYYRWAVKVEAYKFDVWICPYGNGTHWSLIVIIFSQKIIIYLDSLHNSMNNNTKKLVCDFIEAVFNRAGLYTFDWESWIVYSPIDIPHQGETLDCGVHLCIYVHIILTGAIYSFSIADMLQARRWMFNKIMDYKYKVINNKYSLRKILQENLRFRSKRIVANIKYMKESRAPPKNCVSTLNFCRSLKYMW